MPVQPYLCFEGRTEEALAFYREVLGAEVTAMMRWKDCPEGPPPGMLPPGSEDKIMHVEFRVAGSTIMGSDGSCAGEPGFRGFSLTLPAPDATEADRLFAALGDGGQVRMPMDKTFFAERFGIVADRFGVSWMVIVEA